MGMGCDLAWNRKDPQWQRTRFASGTTRTPRLPPASTRRRFPTALWAPSTVHPVTTRPASDVLTVEFTVAGVPCLGLNGGPMFKHNEAFSFQIATDDQDETDRYWNAIVGNGGQESACGWCKDKWGISWQITPRVLTEAMAKGGDDADEEDRRRRDRGGGARLGRLASSRSTVTRASAIL